MGYIVKKLRRELRNTTIFQSGDSILSDSDVFKRIKHLDINIDNKNIINYIEKKDRFVHFDETNHDMESDQLFLRYLGERIAVVLRNREDNFIVYEEFGTNVYQATSPEYDDIYGKIIVHNGFRYKPVILEEEKRYLGVIIEPKSKFFSEGTLRDFYPKEIDEFSDRNTEKICPVSTCQHYLNPYGTCNLNYPSFFGNIKELQFVQEKPSNTTINLFDFYYDEENCPSKFLVENITDIEPVIYKSFLSNPEKHYSYPMEVIRIIPYISDAGSDTKRLMKRIQLKPYRRFNMITNVYMKAIMDIKDLNFPIIPKHLIDESSNSIEKVEFYNPTYLLNSNKSSKFPSLEYKEIGFFKVSCERKEILNFNVLYFEPDNRLKEIKNILESNEEVIYNIPTYKYFSKINDIKYNQVKVTDLKTVKEIVSKENEKQFNFYVLIWSHKYDTLHNKIKSYLIQNDKPNQTIKVQTLEELGFASLTSLIFLQIYLKSTGITWLIEELPREEDIIVGFSLKYFKDHIVSSILFFSNQGEFLEGIYLNEEREDFQGILEEILHKKCEKYNYIIVFYHGTLHSSFLETIKRSLGQKNYDIIEVISNSLIRIFEQDEQTQRIYPPNPGDAIILNTNECHLISSKTRIGTPSCIRIRRLVSSSKPYEELLQTMFNHTRYNPALIKNNTKLPFSIHLSSATLRKGIKYNLNSFTFSLPFYF